ncbi:MAG: DUF2256 domain-containing protein [Planctomycetota bacterium]
MGQRRTNRKPEKVCRGCGRSFEWRKKWKACWNEIRYCSERCRRRKQMASPPESNQR